MADEDDAQFVTLEAVAQHDLGICYEEGMHGFPVDFAVAARLYRLSADQGFVEAYYCLGMCYARGRGVPRDLRLAIRNYVFAAAHGHEGATFRLALAHEHGEGVPHDLREACRLYRTLADRGYAQAQFALGTFYEHGWVVPQDEAEAARLYRLAADKGDGNAQFNLGVFYRDGRGVEQDYAEAARLYRLAADLGQLQAAYSLGHFLVVGSAEPAVPRQPRQGALLLASVAQKAPEALEIRQMALTCLGDHAHEREVARACCVGCGKTKGLRVCGRCRVAKICGDACHRRMWPVHRPNCGRWAAEPEAGGDGDGATGDSADSPSP